MHDIHNHNKYLEDSGGSLYFAQALLCNAKITQHSHILEIGCGTGIFAEYLSVITHAKVIGVEQSLQRAKIANERIKCVYVTDGNIPQEFGTFDLIYCQAVLPLIDNKFKFYKMIRIYLKQGGTFCTYLPSTEDVITKPLYKFIPFDMTSSLMRYNSIEKNIKFMYRAGFNKVRTIRIPLGSVWLNDYYVYKHLDGYFSNAKKTGITSERILGSKKMQSALNTLIDYGITCNYEFERTMLIAQ